MAAVIGSEYTPSQETMGRIFDALAEHCDGLRVKDLENYTKLPHDTVCKATVYMENHGLIIQGSEDRFRIRKDGETSRNCMKSYMARQSPSWGYANPYVNVTTYEQVGDGYKFSGTGSTISSDVIPIDLKEICALIRRSVTTAENRADQKKIRFIIDYETDSKYRRNGVE